MKRTGFRDGFLGNDDNVAKAYGALDDGKPVLIDSVKAGDKAFGGANGVMRTCVSDLLTMYTSLLAAASHQFSTGKTAISIRASGGATFLQDPTHVEVSTRTILRIRLGQSPTSQHDGCCRPQS